jgi:tripeptide aminopeptidase
VLLVANVGEEGEGNLSGMRYLCRHSLPTGSVKAFLVLDGPSTDHITVQALASRRFEVSFTGPGGHSWNDWGTPNPVHALGNTVSFFLQSAESLLPPDHRSKSSYNFGILQGGTSINAIPTSALAKVDFRSEEPAALDEFTSLLTASVERGLERENRDARAGRLNAKIRELGSRPGGSLPSDAPLLQAIQAVDQHLHIRSRIDCASTDANVPLSLGLPAISIGVGGQGGGAHSPQEWYSPDGRELGLRRILLVIAALSTNIVGPGSSPS